MKEVTFNDFAKLDIRVGQIKKVEIFEELNKPAYKLWVDFGGEIGIKKSSAQLCELYSKNDLISKYVLGVVNFPEKQIKNFMSEVLILGIYTDSGVSLIVPDKNVKKGDKLG